MPWASHLQECHLFQISLHPILFPDNTTVYSLFSFSSELLVMATTLASLIYKMYCHICDRILENQQLCQGENKCNPVLCLVAIAVHVQLNIRIFQRVSGKKWYYVHCMFTCVVKCFISVVFISSVKWDKQLIFQNLVTHLLSTHLVVILNFRAMTYFQLIPWSPLFH